MKPEVHDSCFVHKTAVIIGNVTIGKNVGIWPHAIIRGDQNSILIGDNSNVQDCCVVHVDSVNKVKIGNNVSLGHGAVVHGATIEDNVVVGMKAVVMNASIIGQGSVIAAGALVKEGVKIPPNSLVVGVPGKIAREGDASLKEYALKNAQIYVELAKRHKDGEFQEF